MDDVDDDDDADNGNSVDVTRPECVVALHRSGSVVADAFMWNNLVSVFVRLFSNVHRPHRT